MDDPELRRQLEQVHRQAFTWALHCCGHDPVEAEDVLQTAYLKVLDGRARFHGRSSFTTWLFAVIRHGAADERRRRTIRLERHRPLDDETGPPAEEESETAAPPAALTRALGELSERQKEMMLLVFYHERTIEEAARILGIGVGSARTHYARGKERLKTLLLEAEVRDDG